jgi:Ca2+/Na+ antiporter
MSKEIARLVIGGALIYALFMLSLPSYFPAFKLEPTITHVDKSVVLSFLLACLYFEKAEDGRLYSVISILASLFFVAFLLKAT